MPQASTSAAEIKHLASSPVVLEVDGEWVGYLPAQPIPPETLALYCRPQRPRKAPVIAEADCPVCQRDDRAQIDDAIRTGTSANDDLARRFEIAGAGGIAGDEILRLHRAAGHVAAGGLYQPDKGEQQRIAERDFSPTLAVAVPVPFPRVGDAYVALRPLRLMDLAGGFRQLLPGDVLHPDEVAAGGRGIDALVAQMDVAKLPADRGIVGLAGMLLDRVHDLDREIDRWFMTSVVERGMRKSIAAANTPLDVILEGLGDAELVTIARSRGLLDPEAS